MRLKTKYKTYTKSKTEKQKKLDKEKKSNLPKISPIYNSTSPYNVRRATIDLTKLTYGIIDSCELTSINMMDGQISLSNSWIELLLIMIDALIENKPDNFIELLSMHNVTNQWFCIDKYYGKYTFEYENPKVYNIYNSGYYLEAIFNNSNIFHAIIGLTRCLGYQLNEIQLNIRNPKIDKNINEIEFNPTMLETEESIVDIDGVYSMLKSGIHLVGMQILGSNAKVHRIDVALMLFCNWIYDNYGISRFSTIKNIGNTGISLECTSEDEENENGNKNQVQYEQIRNSGIYVYTDLNNEDIIKFIKNTLKSLNMDKSQLKFKFRALKEKNKLKEWEIE